MTAGEPHRVLVVDDEPFNVEYLDQELADRGYLVESALDGAMALAMVADSPPDLILLDVIMPGIDGIEVCRRIKDDAETRLIPIIIMTALSDADDRIRGIEAGADDFLTKPVDLRELFARIRTALRTKVAIDDAVHELRSATEQITQLGQHDEDVAVVVVGSSDETAREPLASAIEASGGVEATSGGGSAAAIFRGGEAAARARAAVDMALRLESRPALGVAVGSALLGVDRRGAGSSHEWAITVEGPTAAEARMAAGAAEPGQVLVTTSVVEQLGGGYTTTPAGESGGLSLFAVGAAASSREPASHEIAFPGEFSDLLPVLHEEWGVVDLYLAKMLGGGKSGARVMVVDISCEDFSGQAILKLEAADDGPGDGDAEAERHRRAVERNEVYASDHLPRLLKFLIRDGCTATLSTIAAGGLEYCSAWFRTPYEAQLTSAERISNDLLESWNADYHLEAGLVVPSSILQRWLVHRLEPGVGRLDAVLTDLIGVEPDEPTFILDGLWYPNPLAFARRADEITAEPPLRGVVGQVHGDLHGYNVLTSHRRSDVADYFLIDLAFYEGENYLFFDHAYFELSYLMRTRENAGPSRWLELLEGVFGDNATNANDIGIIRIVDAVRSGQQQWIRDHEEHRTGYMESQMLLGQVGAGLNYANKRMSTEPKVQAFLYSTVALKEYIELQGIDWPRAGGVAALSLP